MPTPQIVKANEDAIEKALEGITSKFAVVCYADERFVKALAASDRTEADLLADGWNHESPNNGTRLRTDWFRPAPFKRAVSS